jgi:hypothetical protein
MPETPLWKKGWKEDHGKETKVGIELADAMSRVEVAIRLNSRIGDERLKDAFVNALKMVRGQEHLKNVDAEYLNQVGGAFNLVASEAVQKLGETVGSIEDLDKLSQAYYGDMACQAACGASHEIGCVNGWAFLRRTKCEPGD